MIDFGTSKLLKSIYGTPRTFTMTGTPHYMAPEIIKGKGYSFLVDLWSIGICSYEFLCESLPFGNKSNDPYEVYQEIIKHKLNFPSKCKDKKARKLISQLLSPNPEIRLGGSYASLKGNEFFTEINWDDLFNKKIKAPYYPSNDELINEIDIQKEKLNLEMELMVN